MIEKITHKEHDDLDDLIKEMPDKETLEEFLRAIIKGEPVTVVFNSETGLFERFNNNNE